MFSKIALGGRYVGASAIVLLTIFVAGEVILRLVFSTSFEGLEELSGYLLVAITYLTAADSFSTDGFMRVAVLYDRLKPKNKGRLDRILALLAAVLCGGLTIYFINIVLSSLRNGIVSPTFNIFPIWVPQTAMVLGMALLCIACIRVTVLGPRSKKPSTVESDLAKGD
ncbi:MAG: TRAP transporter small permease [Proteobacteria bacterium]|nr:TRAP transporter small permease [Pseudomonadota bacterium]